MRLQKPKALYPGSRVAVLSPSWGGAFHFPHIFDRGIWNLTEILGLEPVEFPSARADSEYLYDNPQARADDINRAFADPEIDAVFASIGGSDSIRILPHLDLDAIVANPKILMGFSDTTTLLTTLSGHGLVTFHGPSVMAGWAQFPSFDFLADYYRRALFQEGPDEILKPFPQWANGYFDWSLSHRAGEVDDCRENVEGHIWVQGEGCVAGRLWGGCLEVLDWMKGTAYWPHRDFWDGRILFFETSEEKPSADQVAYSLRNLGVQGVLERIRGLLIGRPKDYTPMEKSDLYETVSRVCSQEFGRPDLPIVANLDFGHTEPNLILPLGLEYSIDCNLREIRRLESCYQD